MALSYKSRRRLSMFLLVVWLPFYVIAAVTIMGMVPELPKLAELAIYILLGVLWVVPFKPVFMGVGQADPDANPGLDDPGDTPADIAAPADENNS